MGMNIGANDVSTMLNKSSMVGGAQQLRVDQRIKETDKTAEAEKSRDQDAEATTADNGGNVGSAAGAGRTAPNHRGGQELRGMGRLYRGSVEWQQERNSGNQGSNWLPPSLQPQARGAGTSNPYNVPYWLTSDPQSEQPQEDNPLASHRRLISGLRSMVKNDIEQYVKSSEPPYEKKTLREFYTLLSDGGTGGGTNAPSLGGNRLTGQPLGYNRSNWDSAENVTVMFRNGPRVGDQLDWVA